MNSRKLTARPWVIGCHPRRRRVAVGRYDAAFKCLMEDQKAACLIISTITDLDVEHVELRPTEFSAELQGGKNLTVYRLDFAARVRTTDGTRLVLVEIQKAKFHTDIQRFRRYLGGQYASADNYEPIVAANGVERKRALPIYSIYILGHTLEHNSEVPVIRVSRTYTDVATGAALPEHDEFVESLTHDSAVIQVPALKARRRNRLEQMLSVFDQALIRPGDPHVIDIREEDYPEEFRPIVRRLLKAIAENEVRKFMTAEDEFLSELEARDRITAKWQEQAEAATQREVEERRQKEEERRQKEEERRQKEALAAKLDVAVKRLVANGLSDAEARKLLDS